jgi:hypothetical protein
VPSGKCRFDPGLSTQEPIHRRVQGIRVCGLDVQGLA